MAEFSITQSVARQLAEAWYQTVLDEIKAEQEVNKSQVEQLSQQEATEPMN